MAEQGSVCVRRRKAGERTAHRLPASVRGRRLRWCHPVSGSVSDRMVYASREFAVSAPAGRTAWLGILGIGENGVEGLSQRARQWLVEADHVYGGTRHLTLAASLIGEAGIPWSSPLSSSLPALMEKRGRKVAVLASGDPFSYGIGPWLTDTLSREEWFCIPVPSCLSLARSALGWAEVETETVSLCGRPLETLYPFLQPDGRVLILSADASTPALVAGEMTRLGFGSSTLWLMEALGGEAERIRHSEAKTFSFSDIMPLNMLAVEVVADQTARMLPLSAGLPDACFAHDGQITKQDVRAATLAALSPHRGELLWDIGCGSGSIAIEWLRHHPSMRAIGIEADTVRAQRGRQNAHQLGVPRLNMIEGHAPEALDGLPVPDAVFIGGGCSGVMISRCQAELRPGGRLVVNAVTLETEALLAGIYQTHGGRLTRLSVATVSEVGRLHAFRPAMTVTQWAWRKPLYD
ncbi:Precorrin-6Y C5,15-methyltransferase [decarboxylating] [Granulibacter bethesdensis CGDNIH1]|uniref:Precorrin-6Y C5,15-methyltransferase [decarboxylating] n=1 Tax=Granulibacter bethesdensis (strain ATCC BAA-1260 / CGDNIH1) TaxID=391165 RepID=Q0BUE1_GRABC|nr:Precorrin-6Y C5,15-methyltransferase [decarboxylating] [Granulibacter bethesdensis CGDNIH1]APH51360.1 Precorrin-6Y C5,15-methyltransferase [decarboxylating] [Granulibacter bethesdensis]APH64053.1 Precorrin-6Y C5,15-methyltransferase [decarboxylating] [Granulibacter bethesdensis]